MGNLFARSRMEIASNVLGPKASFIKGVTLREEGVLTRVKVHTFLRCFIQSSGTGEGRFGKLTFLCDILYG